MSSWSAKLICGKSIPASDDTYIHDAELKDDFIKISKVLRLFPKNTPAQADRVKRLEDALFAVEKENTNLKTRIEVLQQKFESHDTQLRETIPETFKEINERIIEIEKHVKLKRPFIFGKREKLK
jgi:predicted  nucleic acid-binding Zn-ribbon protein